MPPFEPANIVNLTSSLQGSYCHKLRFLVDLCQKNLKVYGIVNPGIFRFRGDTLEISIRPTKEDYTAYVKVGVFISYLKKLIHVYGFLAVANLFPKFDEPELITFIRLSDAKLKSKLILNGQKNKTECVATFIQKFIQLSNSKNLMVVVKDHKQFWYNKKVTDLLGIKPNDFIYSDKLPTKIKIGHCRNMPTIWLQVGDFIGEMLFEASYEAKNIDLNINIDYELIDEISVAEQASTTMIQFASVNVV